MKTGPDGFTGEFDQFSTISSRKIEAGEILPNSFYEARITLITKPDKDIAEKKTTD